MLVGFLSDPEIWTVFEMAFRTKPLRIFIKHVRALFSQRMSLYVNSKFGGSKSEAWSLYLKVWSSNSESRSLWLNGDSEAAVLEVH